MVNPASGWSLRPCGDIYDIVLMMSTLRSPMSLDRATVIGEFGGIGYYKEQPMESRNAQLGLSDLLQSQKLLGFIYKFNQILDMKERNGLSAAFYTQTTDVGESTV